MNRETETIVARLYRQIKDLEEQRDAMVFTYNQADAECARLRALLVRAADTLEEEFGDPNLGERDLSDKSPWNLIIELRKAAL